VFINLSLDKETLFLEKDNLLMAILSAAKNLRPLRWHRSLGMTLQANIIQDFPAPCCVQDLAGHYSIEYDKIF